MISKLFLLFVLVLALCNFVTAKKANARDGGQLYLSCDPGKAIDVTDAYYGSLPRGRGCDDPNALTTVQGLANEQNSYTLSVTDTTFSTTTCQANNREAFQITYNCNSITSTTTSNQGTTLTLSCSSGKVLSVTKAVYADDTGTCSDPNAMTTAKSICDGKETCDITVNDATFTSSTCTTEIESLDISYLCSKVVGGMYTHWGGGSCGTGSQNIQSGFMVGAKAGEGGSGSSWECFPDSYVTPDNANTNDDAQRGKIYGVELISADPPFDSSKEGKAILCSVCQLYTRNAIVMVPGTHTCPSGYTEQYKGYIVAAGSSSNNIPQDYVCLDENVDVGTESGNNQAKAYPVQVKCGALDCGTYPDNAEIKCIVCST